MDIIFGYLYKNQKLSLCNFSTFAATLFDIFYRKTIEKDRFLLYNKFKLCFLKGLLKK